MAGREYLFQNILVPVRPDPELCVLPYAQAFARATGGQLHFLLVSGEDRVDEGKGFLETLEKRTRELRLECVTRHEVGSLVPVVCKIAREMPADLVILTRHRESQHLHLLCESLQSRSGPFHTPCPVLVVPAFPVPKEARRDTPMGTGTLT